MQGVGFRPFVYGLARSYAYTGTVRNGNNGVHIYLNASRKQASAFLDEVLSKCPKHAIISTYTIQEVETTHFDSFQIVHSSETTDIDLAITPDFGLCLNCKEELNAKNNRRYQYPFITCTHCGPRYSIIEALPFDRHRTTMDSFTMCNCCNDEYKAPLDRRYFSQTNSCSECGVSIKLTDKNGDDIQDDIQIFSTVYSALNQGKTIAIKGIGGYLLLCDATNAKAIQELRTRKNRKEKPFAVLYPSYDLIQGDVIINKEQKQLVEGSIAPIVLLPLKQNNTSGLAHKEVAPNLNKLGVMLPYAPILELISKDFGKPLVATSANLSGSPIIYQDKQAFEELFNYADYVLTNNRKITTCQDDSVVNISPIKKDNILLRRSRGLAPNFYHSLNLKSKQSILSLGAQMKGAFSILNNQNVYVSQYLGSLEGYEAQLSFREALSHFINLVKLKPEVILVDQHPSYFTTLLGEELGKHWNVPVKTIQHHEAHFAAVLAENELQNKTEKVLGVIWDGTGYGTDGQIWGGEFFTFKDQEIKRATHFEYFPVLAGEKMMKEPRLSSFSLTEGASCLKDKFSTQEWAFYKKMVQSDNQLQTSSVGRVFDAISSVLGLVDKTAYEGQAGILLEQLATDYLTDHPKSIVAAYPFTISKDVISIKLLLQNVSNDLQEGIAKGHIAARFHLTMASIIEVVAEKGNFKKIAMSGGVFQNGLLTDLIKIKLENKYDLYFHKQLSPNDENISFGQTMHYLIHSKLEKKLTDEYFLDTI